MRRVPVAATVLLLLLAGCQPAGDAGEGVATSGAVAGDDQEDQGAGSEDAEESGDEQSSGAEGHDGEGAAGETDGDQGPGPTSGSSDDSSDDGSGADTGTSSEPDTDAALPPWTTGHTEVDIVQDGDAGSGDAPGGQEITAIRAGAHDGYDRVVLDLTGDEPRLGWYAAFTDAAWLDPVGEPMDVEGPAYLELGIRGIDWIVESPERYDGGPVHGRGTQVVNEVVPGGLFEGQQQIVIGLTEQTAYRVFRLADPARIVIDVRPP